MRIGEYVRLDRSHLEPHARAIEIPGAKTDGSERTIFVEDSAWRQDHFGHATRDVTQRYTRRVNQGRAAAALSGLVLPYVRR